jgi:protein-S-isoprenylcysteine O-methyltransferase Ste14
LAITWFAGSIILLFGLWAWLHSYLAAPRVKSRIAGRLGPAASRWYRLIYNVIAVVTLAPVLVLGYLRPGRVLYSVGPPVRNVMTAVQGLALLAMTATLLQTGIGSFLGLRSPGGRESDGLGAGLTVAGLYRYVRHPLYLLGILLLWLTPEMTLTRLVLFLAMTVYFYVGSIHEERSLELEFGTAYREYRSQVPALFPLPGRRVS